MKNNAPQTRVLVGWAAVDENRLEWIGCGVDGAFVDDPGNVLNARRIYFSYLAHLDHIPVPISAPLFKWGRLYK